MAQSLNPTSRGGNTWKEKLNDCHLVLREITSTVQSVSKQMETLESPPIGEGAKMPSSSSELPPQKVVVIGGRDVIVTGAVGMDMEKISKAVPFQDWIAKVSRNKMFIVKSITIQGVDMFGPHKVGFLKFNAAVEVEGKNPPGIVFMRGGAVAILVLLRCQGKMYSLMVKQHRVPVGETFFPEIPAGMLDGDGNFGGVAAKELKEETGIEIKSSDLIDMTEMTYGGRYIGMYPSCGGSDEYNRLFLYRRDVSIETLQDLEGRLTGVAEEGESIKLHIIPYDDMWTTTPDAKALCAICLYEKLIQAGKISPY